MNSKIITIQGHRGARGLFPENTLVAFLEAVKLGVGTLELDIVISADKQVVVSHEAWMNEDFCSGPDGKAIAAGSGKNFNLFKMTYAEIRQYDCGRRGNPEFPRQKKIPASKPLFTEVIAEVDRLTKNNQLPPVFFNIEIKTEAVEGLFNPDPGTFVDLVYTEVNRLQLRNRVSLQSFDLKILQQIKKRDSGIKTGLLTETAEPLSVHLEKLGFIPDVFSPEFSLVDQRLVEQAHQKNMPLITWTVNEAEDMKRLLSYGVDGIITDYPDVALALINNI
ncbi:MAG: glycerophosphodiester phosphodiesterase family protein [Bacteroidota bacterium]